MLGELIVVRHKNMKNIIILIVIICFGVLGYIIISRNSQNGMQPKKSKIAFLDFVQSAGYDISELSTSQAVDLMLGFYKEVPAANCSVENQGDMLLFQWGTYDWGKGKTFNFNITRQFILDGTEGDDGMSQLSLTIHFEPTSTLDALGSGNRWCSSPEELPEFEKFIHTNNVFGLVKEMKPLQIELSWSKI